MNKYMFFFISISFISIPEARFEKKISIAPKFISIWPRLRLDKNQKIFLENKKIRDHYILVVCCSEIKKADFLCYLSADGNSHINVSFLPSLGPGLSSPPH